MKQKSKWTTPIVIVLVLLSLIVASVFAAYYKETLELNNTFKPAVSIKPDIEETFTENDNELKEDVYFNVGKTEYPVYVRAKIVINWQNSEKIIYFSPVSKDDYGIDLNVGENGDWVLQKDGFYYYKYPVPSEGNTTNLINKCWQINPAPADGYTLSVELIVQTIQADGSTDDDKASAWEDAGWNVP